MSDITNEQLAEWRAIEASATPEPWMLRKDEFDNHDQMIAAMSETLRHGHHVLYYLEHGRAVFTAFTGNGPTSEANARLIFVARAAFVGLMDALALAREEAKTNGQVLARLGLAREDFEQKQSEIARLTAERDEARHKLASLAEAHTLYVADLQAARIQLDAVRTNTDGVWLWQGEGDHPESLSCPVVMTADTLRGIVAQLAAMTAERDNLRPLVSCPTCRMFPGDCKCSGGGA